MVALVTPFNERGGVDYDELRRLVELHGRSRTEVVVSVGTTGESPTLSHAEHMEVIARTVMFARRYDGLRVIAGTGSNCTHEALQLTEASAEAGADGALLITPYYNRPSPRGVIGYYRELDKVGIPIWVYNLPRRTGINVSPETMLEIVQQCENVVGLKASNGNLQEITEIVRDCSAVRPNFQVVSGDDSLTVPIMSIGGVGAISVIANVVPDLAAQMISLFRDGQTEAAAKLQQRLMPLSRACMEIQASPAGVKAMLRGLGYKVGAPRSPMTDVDDAEAAELMRVYQEVINGM
jgi:4-hydroxy-tetrahydrodipicolinate synthase